MVGRIARYKGDNQWQDMADAGAPAEPKEARRKVAATLAQKSEETPPATSAAAPQGIFGSIAGRKPAPNRSGQKLGKSKEAAAVSKRFKEKLAKTGEIVGDMTGWNAWKRLMDNHVYGGKPLFDPETGQPDEQAVADSFSAATAAMTGSMPFPRPSNSVSIFLGPRAKNFPQDAAAKAYDLLRSGMSPEEVRVRTGITFDSAGIPRFEVPSQNDFTLTKLGEQYSKGRAQDPHWRPAPAKDVINAPVMFENYPEMMDWPTRIAEDGGISGMFTPSGDWAPKPTVDVFAPPGMSYTKNYPHGASIETVTAHELGGHGIDWIEGGSFGAMPRSVSDRVKAAFPNVGDYELYRRAGGETWANMQAYRNSLDADAQGAISPYFDGPAFGGKPLPKYQEEFPRREQWSQQLDTARDQWATAAGGPFSFKYAFDPEVHQAPSDRPDLTPPPQPKKGRRPISRFGMAAQEASGDAGGLVDEMAATPVPATNGPRPRGSKRTGPTSEELLQQAISTPRKVSQRGTFVGAPPGVNTPEAEQALVDDLMSRLQGYQGTGERFYDDFQNAIRANTEDPVMARRFVSSSGHTSNQMSPLPNTTHAAKAMNQYAVGDPVLAGLYPNTSGPKAAESMAADQLSPDPKTGPYGYALLPPEMRPANYADYAWGGERAVRGRAVHDIWDKEAFRYARNAEGKHNAASDTEHLFMDRIYNQLVHRISRDPELRARYGTGPQAYERIQAALWDIARGNADKFDVLPADEIIRRHMGITQMAAIPGPSTGVDSALLNAPLDMKRQYTDDMFNALSTEGGRNIPAASLGFTPPMEEGFGPWQGMKEPNRSIGFMSGATGSGADKAIDPASATAARTMRNWNQFILGQEGSGFTYPSDAGATRKASDLVTIGGVKMDSPEAYDRAMKAVEEVYGPQWADNVVVQPVPGTGELMLKNISGGNNQEFGKMAQGVSKRMNGGKISGLRDIGNDFTFVQFNDPSYRTLMDETRSNPVLKKTFDEKVLPHLSKVQAESERWAKNMGLPAETVPDRVRRIFIAAGVNWPQAMDEAVKKGIIPAFAGAALLGGAANQFGGEEGVQ